MRWLLRKTGKLCRPSCLPSQVEQLAKRVRQKFIDSTNGPMHIAPRSRSCFGYHSRV